MNQERGRQIPFGDLGVVLVTDLNTGRQTLRRKRVSKSAAEPVRKPAPTEQWWERMGVMAFSSAAEGWKQRQSVMLAERFGQNVEFSGGRASGDEAEILLKKAFGIAKRSRITSVDVVGMMKAESLNLEQKLGVGANWVPAFVDSAINLLSEVYGLNLSNTEALKRVAHQRRLPQFI